MSDMIIKKPIAILLLLSAALYLKAVPPRPKPVADPMLLWIKDAHFRDISTLADAIKRQFRTEEDKLRAIFLWTASHLSYDLASARQNSSPVPLTKAIELAFKNRKAVCEGYAGIMDSLNRLCGIESFLVSGYTRQSGRLDPTPHMWLATRSNGQWHLHDPTWGSGSVINNRFVPNLDESFLMVRPEAMIATHMPYDPLWQLLNKPLTHKEFIHQQKADGPVWIISDSLVKWQQSQAHERWQQELRRLMAEKFTHQATQSRINFLKQNIRINEINRSVYQLNTITNQLNTAIEHFNQAVEIQNKRGRTAAVNERLMQSKQLTEQLLAELEAVENYQQIKHEKARLSEALRSHHKKTIHALKNWQ